MHIVLIETSGNQNYIFATNKLRENVGASQLTHSVGTRHIIEGAHRANGVFDGKIPQTYPEMKGYLLHEQEDGWDVEIIIATSGKAILLIKSDDHKQSEGKAKEIISYVTQKTLHEAPGLSIFGVIRKFDTNSDDLDKTIKRLHEDYEVVRSKLPGPEHRFLRFPFAQPCATSGFPARYAKYFKAEKKTVFRSAVAQTKRDASQSGRDRMQAVTETHVPDATLPENLEKFEEAFPKTDWLAVIHADGNGLGQIFLNFGENSDCKKPTDWRTYLNKQRAFSLALDDCTINAYGFAVHRLYEHLKELLGKESNRVTIQDHKIVLPLLPLILGGDDLTVICDGRYAIQFAKEFLGEFERQTATNEVIKPIAKNALGVERLSSCAGVAIVKPH
ncbi:MAG: Cas10/Cmr2 second palm domain-containing protein, partial [Pyrinomonadaceae bacterium]